MKKVIRLRRDGSTGITYGSIEKNGVCFHDGKEPCGVWCPLFPVVSDKWEYPVFFFNCHGGDPIMIRANVDDLD